MVVILLPQSPPCHLLWICLSHYGGDSASPVSPLSLTLDMPIGIMVVILLPQSPPCHLPWICLCHYGGDSASPVSPMSLTLDMPVSLWW